MTSSQHLARPARPIRRLPPRSSSREPSSSIAGMFATRTSRSVRAAGYTDGEIAEIIAHVALNVFTNYFNRAAQTDIDFPLVTAGQLA